MDERIAVAVGDVFSIASIGWFDAFDRFALVADHVLFCAIGVSDEFVIDATEDDLIVAYIFFAFGFGTFVLDSVANEAGFYVCAILDDIRAIFGDFVVLLHSRSVSLSRQTSFVHCVEIHAPLWQIFGLPLSSTISSHAISVGVPLLHSISVFSFLHEFCSQAGGSGTGRGRAAVSTTHSPP